MPLRVVTWNVDGFRAMLARRNESALSVLQKLGADIVCIQETKLSKADLASMRELSSVQGWQSYFGLCRLRPGYAGLATFVKAKSVPVLAAEEGLGGTDADRISDSIHAPSKDEWHSAALPAGHQLHNDNEGRAVVTDHGTFVLFNIYGPAVTDTTAERFPRKLSFYKALRLRLEKLVQNGRKVIVAGDLNIAKEPLDNCDWADSRLARAALMKAFVEDRPDRAWFLDFLDAGRPGAPVDLLRRFHPDRRCAYTVWGRTGNKRQRNYGSRVDYVLLAESSSGTSSATESDDLLPKVTGCDIQPEWEGSDHAPVWAEIDVEPPMPESEAQLPRMESRNRFKQTAGGQQQLTSWLQPATRKRRRSSPAETTPPRRSIGEELALATAGQGGS